MTPSPRIPLARSIGRSQKLVRAWVDRELAPFDSSVTEWIVLFHIGAAELPGASQNEIARFSDIGGPALVRHIDRLEAEGIVARTRDADDRRVTRVTLTAAGERRADELREVIARCDARLREQISVKEAQALEQALDKLFAFCLGELRNERGRDHDDEHRGRGGAAAPQLPDPRTFATGRRSR